MLSHRYTFRSRRRTGKIVVLIAILLPLLLALMAFAIDLQMLYLTKVELKRSANTAALAGAVTLLPSPKPPFPLQSPVELSVAAGGSAAVTLQSDFRTEIQLLGHTVSLIDPTGPSNLSEAREAAIEVAERNRVIGVESFKQRREDVAIMARPSGIPAPPLIEVPALLQGLTGTIENLLLKPQDDRVPNTVRVITRRDATANGPVPFLFGPMVGTSTGEISAAATATFSKGYGVKPGAPMLPLAMDITVWRIMRLGNGTINGVPLIQTLVGGPLAPVWVLDERTWNRKSGAVSPGSDGIWEVLLTARTSLPIQVPLINQLLNRVEQAPVLLVRLNLGTGRTLPSSSVTAMQIRHGITAADIPDQLYLPFTRFGQEIHDQNVIDALKEMIGQPCILPLFKTISGTAGNKIGGLLGADEPYQIVGFGGIVITDVQEILGVAILRFQPASVMHASVLAAPNNLTGVYSDCVYTTPALIE